MGRGQYRTGIPQYVALAEGERVVGWCDIIPNSHPGFDHGGRLGVGVLLAYRGQGIGRRLVRTTIERARVFGLERVELEVFASNAQAIRLYEQFGFEHEGCRRGARKSRGGYEDVLIMGLPFNSPREAGIP